MRSAFEVNKIRRLIKTQGKLFKFEHFGENEFGEFDPNIPISTAEFSGVYHETSSHVTVSETTGTRSQTKPVPMVLTLWENVLKSPVYLDDKLICSGKTYRVTGVTNIQEGNYGADISLEVIL